MVGMLNLSSLTSLDDYLALPASSAFKVFLKFLNDTSTAVTLSNVLLAIECFRTSSTAYPQT